MDDLVRVAIVDNEPTAQTAVSLLETEGIRAMWRKTDVAAAFGVGSMGPIEILVLTNDAQRAHELLDTEGLAKPS